MKSGQGNFIQGPMVIQRISVMPLKKSNDLSRMLVLNVNIKNALFATYINVDIGKLFQDLVP